ncbi:hypothetical protein H2200_013241 [Cladophialophora chaetospira]|uniref:Rhodopsin domain-containing protein n=1 Tax=Cladophialophora chaetospira TaxID=386627 RepID=A0AA38WWF3_9EURO|nr:hypothetical protein H2200_013241 [Cladophialophora chaetospira]
MGWVHNLHDPNAVTRAPRLIAICAVFSGFALLAIVLRFYVRLRSKRNPWYDDYATLFSAILGAAYSGVAVAQTRWGQGLESEYFPLENAIPFSKVTGPEREEMLLDANNNLQVQYAGGPIYTLAVLGFKLSLLASYLRIVGFNRTYATVIYVTMVACTCNQIIFTFLITFACSPVAKQWDPSIPGHCIHTVQSYYGTSLGFDVLIIAIPIPILLKLKLNKRQKIGLIGVFCLGFFITVIQIIRIFTIKSLKTYTDSESIVIWSAVEINLGVIICCIPTFAPLFRTFSQKVSSGHSNSRTRGQSGSKYLRGQSHPRESFHHLDSSSTGKNMRNGGDTFSNKTAITSANAHELKPIQERDGTNRNAYGYVARTWSSNVNRGGREEVEREGSEEFIIPHDANGKITATTEVTVEREDKY